MPVLEFFIQAPETNPYPMQRCRATATGHYLASPFPIPGAGVDLIDQYWESIRMVNEIIDSIGSSWVADLYRTQRMAHLKPIVERTNGIGVVIENAVTGILVSISGLTGPSAMS